MVKLNVPGPVGVPVIAPVEGSKLKPGGVGLHEYVYGPPFPPAAETHEL